MGSVGLGLALTGIGVVGPLTMTCPAETEGSGVRAGWAEAELRARVRVGGLRDGRSLQLGPVPSKAKPSWVQAVGPY